MPILNDGTIVPDYLGNCFSGGSRAGYEVSASDGFLRVGRVIKVHAPEDRTNTNGVLFEYDVKVEFNEGTGVGRRIVYPRCKLARLFGGQADFFRYTPRLVAGQDADPTILGPGSLVLISCVNGDRREALIIGGYPHSQSTEDDPSLGHNLLFSFNGISIEVNKDGELTLDFHGATKDDGTPADSVAPGETGSQLQFRKSGSIVLQTFNSNNYIKLNNFGENAGDIDIHTNNNLNLLASSVSSICTIKATMGVKVGAATDAWVKGTTYRLAESAMNTQILAGLGALAGQAATAGAALTSAGVLMVTPVVGAVAAAIPIGTAGGIMTSMAATIAQLISAIAAFEAGSPSYLSLLNKTD